MCLCVVCGCGPQVVRLATLHKIYMRAGCFCNPGACQRYLDISEADVRRNLEVRSATLSFLVVYMSVCMSMCVCVCVCVSVCNGADADVVPSLPPPLRLLFPFGGIVVAMPSAATCAGTTTT